MNELIIRIGWLIVFCVFIFLVAIWSRKQKPQPYLIDLEKYAADALESKDRGGMLLPPVGVPGREDREWTYEEKQIMRRNQRVAREIYDYVKGK